MNKKEEITFWSIQLHALDTLLKALIHQRAMGRITAKEIIEGYIPAAIEITKDNLERSLEKGQK